MLVQVKRPPKQFVSKSYSQIKRMIFGNKQLCLVCRNRPIIGNKFLRMQEVSKPYIHARNCSQEGRF